MSSSWDVEIEGQLETTGIDLRVVMLTHGASFLYHIPLLPSDKWMDVSLKLKKNLVTSRGFWMSKLMNAVPFLMPVVYNATMSPVRLHFK